MSELSPGARDVLERARSGHDPTPVDRARVRAGLAATIAGTAGTAGAAGAAAGGAASAAAGSASVAGSAFPAAKLIVMAVLVGGAALGGGIALRGGDQGAQPAPSLVRPGPEGPPRRELTPAAPAPAIDARPAPHGSPPATAPDAAGPEPEKESIGPRPARPRGPASRRAPQDPPAAGKTGARAPGPALAPAPAAAAPSPAAVIAPRPVPSARADSRTPAGRSGTPASLAAEAALLQRAALALRRGDHAAALSLASQHAARFPRSALDLERDALRAMALCQSGRLADGAALARRVARRAGSLPLASRVRRSCSVE